MSMRTVPTIVTALGIVACSLEPTPETGPRPCVILPGAWENQTHAFRVAGPDAPALLELTDSLTGDEWHTRVGVHPSGRTVYLASHVTGRGIFVSAHRFNPATCRFGPRLSHLAPTRDTAESKRYYGLEPSPDGRVLYQTTEAVGTIRIFGVANEGSLTHLQTVDTRAGGAHTCIQARRLEISPDGRSLYANCNNFGRPAAVQHWRVTDGGGLALVRHVDLVGLDGGIFDPVLHPSGRWLYQPVLTNDSTAPEGTGMYVVRFPVGEDGILGDPVAQRIDDPDLNGPGPEPGSTFDGVYASTVLVHPGGRTAYLTTANVPDGRSWVVVADVDERTGALTVRDRVAVSAPSGVHHGGTLVPDGEGGLFLATFVTDYETGRLELMRILPDGGVAPADPPTIPAGLRDARHPVVVTGS